LKYIDRKDTLLLTDLPALYGKIIKLHTKSALKVSLGLVAIIPIYADIFTIFDGDLPPT
jgi:hypothetical protein